jgi:murein DD-endopeptidase MepM/ murein hydrolase activator NlpD
VKASTPSTVFGKRKEPHTVIIAHGDEIRHFTVRPWMAAFLGSAVAAIAVSYLLATSYLVLRDDLIGAEAARQARLQQVYEDRISALRTQVDHITSRQLLDQKLVETKVSELIERQSQLNERHGQLAPLLRRAENEIGLAALPENAPAPSEKPDIRAESQAPGNSPAATLASLGPDSAQPFSLWPVRTTFLSGQNPWTDKPGNLFGSISESLKTIESDQFVRIANLTDTAYQNAGAIADTLEAAGLPVDSDMGHDDFGKSDVGGPLIPIDDRMIFDAKVKELDEALDALEQVKKEARRLPLANPAPGHTVTSPFGVRSDPMIGTAALHPGMDFRAPVGMEAKATAAGVVVRAGWAGGYGRMVEVDHGNGFATRYAHLSKVLVKVGQKLKAGETVGRTGSSGRSTGPHLHYEIRHNGRAINPIRFLAVGKKLRRYM